MKHILRPLVLVLLITAAPTLCFGMMGIEDVSQQRARELGMEIRANAAGPDAVRVELEFEPAGDLKSFVRVDLEMSDGGKLLLSSSLLQESTKPGHVLVSFAADRANLDKLTLRVVTGSPMDLTGHDLQVKDFVDLAKVR